MAERSGAVALTSPDSETYSTFSSRIGKDGGELFPDFLRRVAGEDPAIHDCPRHLRQGVVCVASIQSRGHARCSGPGVEGRLRTEARGRGRIRWSGKNRAHIGGRLSGLVLGEVREVGSRNLIQLEGEREGGQAAEPRRELVNCIVGPGK